MAANPKDPEAHFELGAAIGLRASYTVSVDGSVLGGARAAKEAYDEHENGARAGARRAPTPGLIVGTYRYACPSMSLPVRWMAYLAGFGGGKERGFS